MCPKKDVFGISTDVTTINASGVIQVGIFAEAILHIVSTSIAWIAGLQYSLEVWIGLKCFDSLNP